MIGSRLNHYEIVRKLGSGGMGDVYAANDRNLGREVALKVLPPAMARDAERLERFRREATAVAALDHPNIVTIFSIEQAVPEPAVPEPASDGAASPPSRRDTASGTLSGAGDASGRNVLGDGGEPVHFITMQLIEGRTLDQLIPRRGMPLDRFFDIAVPLADAVAAAHERSVTHRDLKPGNIMVTPEGRVKVLDFGLAKLAEPVSDDDARTREATLAAGPITGEGKILGTAAYMSPEQAEGAPVDHRTDIFSLGVILYEMVTGEAPFQGDSRISVLSAVVSQEPAPVSEVNHRTPRHLARIIAHSLEKAPRRRFQSALDLRNELEALRREVDSGEIGAAGVAGRGASETAIPSGPTARGWPGPAAISLVAVAAVLVLAAAWYALAPLDDGPGDAAALRPAPSTVVTPVSTVDERPSIAVLYFDNVSGDAGLDWLRTGLPEMLVTDLSQSRGIRVLPTDRMYGILADAGVVDAGASAALDAVGERLGVDRVLLGSVLRSGNRIRIVARLQDTDTGEIVASETLEGDNEEALFDLVDRLTRSVRATFTGIGIGADDDRDVNEVTTSSVAALRHWVEADRYMNLGEYEEARTRLLRAVEIDPEFAMAYAKLAAISGNLGDFDARSSYAETALQHAERLTERERYYVEGTYYYANVENFDLAADAYRKLLDFDPSSTAARNNLALVLWRLDDIDEATAHFETLVDNDVEFVGTWTNLAELYAQQARFDDAEAVLLELAARQPESAVPYDALADVYLHQGRYDDVLKAAEQALLRGEVVARRHRAAVAVLTRDWATAEETLRLAASLSEPALRYAEIPQARADLALYRGDSAAALEALHAALAEVPERGTFTAWLRDRIGYVYEARGDLDEAIHYTELAIADEPGEGTLVWLLPLLGRQQAMAGRLDQARRTAERHRLLTESWPQTIESETRAMMEAAIAIAEDDPGRAVTLLEAAATELPPSGSSNMSHCYLWFDLAVAHLTSGNAEAAVTPLQRIVASHTERLKTPYEYVRALYLLGTIEAERGNDSAARSHYGLFLEHWGDGDLRRDEVEAARAWLATH